MSGHNKVPYIQTEKKPVLVGLQSNFDLYETPDTIEDEVKILLETPENFIDIFKAATGNTGRFFVDGSMRMRQGFLCNMSIDTVNPKTHEPTRKYERAGFQARKRLGYHAFTDVPEGRYIEGSIKTLNRLHSQSTETAFFDKRHEFEGQLSSLKEGLSTISKLHEPLYSISEIEAQEEYVQMISLTSRLTYLTGHILPDSGIIVISEACHDHNIFMTPNAKNIVREDFEFEMEAKAILAKPKSDVSATNVPLYIDQSLNDTTRMILDNFTNVRPSDGSKMQRGLNAIDSFYSKKFTGFSIPKEEMRGFALAEGIKPRKSLLADKNLLEIARKLMLPHEMAPKDEIIDQQNVGQLNDAIQRHLSKEHAIKCIHSYK